MSPDETEQTMNVRMPSVDAIMSRVQERDPEQHEFHQAVQGVFDTIGPVLERNPGYRRLAVLERILEPERVVLFRVPWRADGGQSGRGGGLRSGDGPELHADDLAQRRGGRQAQSDHEVHS